MLLYQHPFSHHAMVQLPSIPITHMVCKALCAFPDLLHVHLAICVQRLQLSQAVLPANLAVLLQPAGNCAGVGEAETPAEVFHAVADRKDLRLGIELQV